MIIVINPFKHIHTFDIGYAYAIISAALYATATLLGKGIDKSENSYVFLNYYTLTCLVFGWISRDTGTPIGGILTPFNIVVMGVMAIANVVGNSLLVRALQSAPMEELLPFKYVALPASFLWGYILWGYIPSMRVVVGGTVIIVAAALVNTPDLLRLRRYTNTQAP